MATRIAPWAIQAIDKLIVAPLVRLRGSSGGKCVVAWDNAVCPKQFSGLGIPNLQLIGFALRLCWLWLARVYMDKT
jgi:hypothetical protein